MTVLMPVVTILAVKMIWDLAKWPFDISLKELSASVIPLKQTSLISIAMTLVLLTNQVGGDVWAIWQSRNCSFPPFIKEVRNLVPSGNRVWGPMAFWFGFYDYSYRTEFTIDTYETMNEYRPDYIILYDSEIWGSQKGVTKRFDPFYTKMEPVRTLLSELVHDRGVYTGSVPSSCYGNVEVYKLQW